MTEALLGYESIYAFGGGSCALFHKIRNPFSRVTLLTGLVYLVLGGAMVVQRVYTALVHAIPTVAVAPATRAIALASVAVGTAMPKGYTVAANAPRVVATLWHLPHLGQDMLLPVGGALCVGLSMEIYRARWRPSVMWGVTAMGCILVGLFHNC